MSKSKGKTNLIGVKLIVDLTKNYLPGFWEENDARKPVFRNNLMRGVDIISLNKKTHFYERLRFQLCEDNELFAIDCGSSLLPAPRFPAGFFGWFSDSTDLIAQGPTTGLEFSFGELIWSGPWLALGPDPERISEEPASEEQRIKYLVMIYASLRDMLPDVIECHSIKKLKEQGLQGFQRPMEVLRNRFGDSLTELRNSSPRRIKELLLKAGLNHKLFNENERYIYLACGLKFVKKRDDPIAKWIPDSIFAAGWLENESTRVAKR